VPAIDAETGKWIDDRILANMAADPRFRAGGPLPFSAFFLEAEPPQDFSGAMQVAAAAAKGRPIWADEREGGYPIGVELKDVDVLIDGPGEFRAIKGKPAFTVVHSIETTGLTSAHAFGLFSQYSSRSFELTSFFTCPPAEIASILPHDVVHYESREFYRAKDPSTGDDTLAANFLSVGGRTDLKTHHGGWAPIRGYGLMFGGSVDLGAADLAVAMAAKDTLNNKTVTSSSGGEGIVASSGQMFGGTKVMVLKRIVKGTFRAGDTLQIGNTSVGTMTADAVLISDETLISDPGPTLRLQRQLVRGLKTKIRARVTANTTTATPSVDGVLSDPGARAAAIELLGTHNAEIRGEIRAPWGAGIRNRGTYMTHVWAKVDNQPNDAYPGQEVFGYGVVDFASEHTHIHELDTRHSRHGVSALVASRTLHPTEDTSLTTDRAKMEALLTLGLNKYLTVEGYVIRDPWGAGIDTHGAAWGTYIGPGRVLFSGSAGRRETESLGLQDRGWNTTVVGLEVTGGVDGVKVFSHRYPAPAPWENTYRNVTVNGHARHGFIVTETAAAVSDGIPAAGQTNASTYGGVYELDNVRTSADRRIHTMAVQGGRGDVNTDEGLLHTQAGIWIFRAIGAKVKIRGGRAVGFNYAPILVQSGSPAVVEVKGFEQDLSASPAGVGPIRIESTPGLLVLDDVTAVAPYDPAVTFAGQLRLNAASATVNHNMRCVNRANVPLLHPSSTGTATATLVPINRAA
jgi:hypothetical protein